MTRAKLTPEDEALLDALRDCTRAMDAAAAQLYVAVEQADEIGDDAARAFAIAEYDAACDAAMAAFNASVKVSR